MFCPNCGAQLEENVKFCAFCGQSVTWDQGDQSQSSASQSYEYEEPAVDHNEGYVPNDQFTSQSSYNDYSNDQYSGGTGVNPYDQPSIGFAILGFFIPLVGLILFFVYRNSRPQRAASCIKGAAIGFVCNFIFSLVRMMR